MVTNGLIDKSVDETLVKQLMTHAPAVAPTLPAKRPLEQQTAPKDTKTSQNGEAEETFDELLAHAKKNKQDSLL